MKSVILTYQTVALYPPIVNAANTMAEAGWNVTIVGRNAGREYGALYSTGVRLFCLKQERSSLEYKKVREIWDRLNFIAMAIKILRREKPYLLVVEGLWPLTIVPIVKIMRPRMRLVVWCLDFAPFRNCSGFDKLGKLVEIHGMSNADMIAAADIRRARALQKQSKLKNLPQIVVNCPRRHHEVSCLPAEAEKKRLRDTLGLGDELILLRSGAVGPGGGLETTIKALRSLPPSLVFVLMGRPRREYCEKLLKLAIECGVNERLRLLEAPDHHTWNTAIHTSYVMHALQEEVNIGRYNSCLGMNRLYLAMAASKPVLVPPEPEVAELIGRYPCGLCARAEDESAVVKALNYLLKNPVEYQNMAQIGRRAFEQEFHFEHQWQPIVDCILDI